MKQYMGGPSTLLSHTQFLQEKFYDLLWIIDKPIHTLSHIITLDQMADWVWRPLRTEILGQIWDSAWFIHNYQTIHVMSSVQGWFNNMFQNIDKRQMKLNRIYKFISPKFPIFLQLIVKKIPSDKCV